MQYKINSANESIIDAIVSGFFKHGGKKYPSIKFSIDDFVFTTYREYSYYTRRTNAHKAAYITGIYIDPSNNVYTIRIDIKVKSGAANLSKQNIDDCLLEFKMWPMRDIIDKSI